MFQKILQGSGGGGKYEGNVTSFLSKVYPPVTGTTYTIKVDLSKMYILVYNINYAVNENVQIIYLLKDGVLTLIAGSTSARFAPAINGDTLSYKITSTKYNVVNILEIS